MNWVQLLEKRLKVINLKYVQNLSPSQILLVEACRYKCKARFRYDCLSTQPGCRQRLCSQLSTWDSANSGRHKTDQVEHGILWDTQTSEDTQTFIVGSLGLCPRKHETSRELWLLSFAKLFLSNAPSLLWNPNSLCSLQTARLHAGTINCTPCCPYSSSMVSTGLCLLKL